MTTSNAAIRAKSIVINVFKYVLLIFSAFVALVPIVSCINTAFKTEEEYAATNVMTLPENWLNFDNFVTAWQQADMGHAFLNSFIILVCVLAGSVMISSMLAYVLNRFKFPGNGLIRNLFTIATLIPGIAAQVTVYQIMTSLHLVNSMPGYIILMMGTDVITIYIFLQFFENLSLPSSRAWAPTTSITWPTCTCRIRPSTRWSPPRCTCSPAPWAASTTTSVPACSSPSSPH